MAFHWQKLLPHATCHTANYVFLLPPASCLLPPSSWLIMCNAHAAFVALLVDFRFFSLFYPFFLTFFSPRPCPKPFACSLLLRSHFLWVAILCGKSVDMVDVLQDIRLFFKPFCSALLSTLFAQSSVRAVFFILATSQKEVTFLPVFLCIAIFCWNFSGIL